jgi:hypothetical protein
MIELFRNSDLGGIFIVLITALIGTAIAFYFIKKSIEIGKLYIFDGGDAGVPYLISFVFIYLIIVGVTYYGFINGVINPEQPLLINLLYISLVTMLLKSRVYAYPTVNITDSLKHAILFISDIIYIILVISSVVFYDESGVIILEGYKLHCISDAMFASLACTLAPGLEMPLLLWFGTVIIEGMLIYFDIIERRAKSIIKRDFLLVISATIYLVFGVFQTQLRWMDDTPLVGFFYLFILWTMFEHFRFESNLVITNTQHINTLLQSTQRLFDKIIKKKNYTPNDQTRFEQILNIIRTNEEVKENFFTKNKFSLKKSRKSLINRLKECYENPERLRCRIDTNYRVEKRAKQII